MLPSNTKWNITIVAVLVILSSVYRLIPHSFNFAPIAGMALLSGAYLKQSKYLAIIIPLIGLLLSDIILNNTLYRSFYSGEGFILFKPYMISTFLSIALIVCVGMLIKKTKIFSILAASLSASVLFFIITNFSSWLEIVVYPKTVAGLIECYIAAIPFFPFTIIGDLVFSMVLFGLAALATRYFYNTREITPDPELANPRV